MWIRFGFDNFVLNFFANFGSVHTTAFNLLSFFQWSFSHPSGLYIMFLFNSWAMTMTSDRSPSLMYRAVRVTELVWLSLIQSRFFTHDCYMHTVIPIRDERSHIFQTPTLLLLLALRLLLLLRKILKHQLRLLLTLRKSQITHIKGIVSILPHEAIYMPWLFCLWLNTNGWGGHVTSTIQRDNMLMCRVMA